MKSEIAIANFDSGLNCAQSVLLAFAPENGLKEETVKIAAAALGGGISNRKYICGAVNAGAIALSFIYSNLDEAAKTELDSLNNLKNEYITNLEKRISGLNCWQVAGLCEGDSEEETERKWENRRSKCKECISEVCKFMEHKFGKTRTE